MFPFSCKMSRRQAIKVSAVEALAVSGMAGSCYALGQEKAQGQDASTDPRAYISDEDREFVERELATFVPDRVFDAHCHLWPPGCDMKLVGLKPPLYVAGLKEWAEMVDAMHPGRKLGAFFIPLVDTITDSKSRDIHNEFVSRQIAANPLCRGSFFVKPDDDPEWVRQEVRRLGLSGLKCYHTHAAKKPTWELDIPAYLPERLIKVAHEEGWCITLHMVKSRAVADPSNIHWIRHYCKTYPNMKLILAHSARAFQPAHALEGLPHLTGLDNLYFDTSANCEPIAHEAIIRIIGHRKLMYGSDFHVSHLRGRPVATGDSFIWLYEDSPVWGEKHLHGEMVRPVLIGLESLRSLKWACWSARCGDSAIEDIFWNNAAQLFGIA